MTNPTPTIERQKPRRERRKARLAMSAREVPSAIQWHEGMLLLPQHFQWMSSRADALQYYHASSIASFYWGVKHLDIDAVALVDGTLRVVDVEGVMPDGLLVAHAASDGVELELDLKAHIDKIRVQPIKVWLGIAKRGIKLDERYESRESEPVADENTGEGEEPVAVLMPKLHLFVGEPPAKYVGFPLAEITVKNEVLSRTSFEPPWLRVAPGSGIYQMCLAIATKLREKAMFLADQIRVPSASMGVPQLLDTKMMVHGLIGSLPGFEALLRSGASHPFPLFVALCGVMGHVAAVGKSLVPPVLEPYDHDDLDSTFRQAETFINKAVAEGVHENYTAYPFLQDGDEFRLRIDPDWMTRTMVLGVHTPSDGTDNETANWVTGSLIASRPRIIDLRNRRVMGLKRTRLGYEADLVPPRGVALYSLTFDAELLLAGEELVITNPGGDVLGRPDWIVLFVKNR